jgi:23S rRNA pseudouridine1911/1915/1917 synthase
MIPKPAETHVFTVTEGAGTRLDLYLSERLDTSRSQVKRLVDSESVLVNGEVVKAGYKLRAGDQVVVTVTPEPDQSLEPQPIPLEIIYEDEELAVINKPKGLVVHPGAGNWSGTLVHALLYHLDDLAEGGGAERPGIVHRLDKDTSGLMVVAKTNSAHAFLSDLLQARLMEKHYLALVHGVMRDDEGLIDKPIGRHPKDRKKMAVVPKGREAQTIFTVVERFRKYTLVKLRLITGRTHQIRVHLSSIHHPIVGDPLYGLKTGNLGASSQMLHACYLAFPHPHGQVVEFNSSPGREFWEIVEEARQIS